MTKLSIDISTATWTRMVPAFYSAYGVAIDPEGRMTNKDFIMACFTAHTKQIVEQFERNKAQAEIVIKPLV